MELNRGYSPLKSISLKTHSSRGNSPKELELKLHNTPTHFMGLNVEEFGCPFYDNPNSDETWINEQVKYLRRVHDCHQDKPMQTAWIPGHDRNVPTYTREELTYVSKVTHNYTKFGDYIIGSEYSSYADHKTYLFIHPFYLNKPSFINKFNHIEVRLTQEILCKNIYGENVKVCKPNYANITFDKIQYIRRVMKLGVKNLFENYVNELYPNESIVPILM